MKRYITWALAAVSVLCAMPAPAMDFSLLGVDVSLSGFATVGYAQSDQHYNYQRFLSDRGTFKRDSLLGLQMDAKLTDQFSLTVQGKLAASIKSDDDLDPTVTWAFLTWRPANDWLFRIGRVRIPLYLNSETTDIGATFDFARLPAEVYSLTPTTNVDGISFIKTWNLNIGEFTLDGYWGKTKTHFRNAPYEYPPLSAEAYFMPVKIDIYGLALTFQRDDDIFRIGAHDLYAKRTDGQVMASTFPYVQIMPGVGYYQVSNQMAGPGLPEVSEIHAPIYTLAANVGIGYGFRVISEYVFRDVSNILTGPASQGAYLAVLKPFEAWTPYISVAHLQSLARTFDLYNTVYNNTVPDSIPGAATINASQRAGATAGIFTYDQTTWALGTSYRINPTSRLKAEWALTHVGDMSSLIDAPPGDSSRGKVVNVFSFSYSVVF